MLLTNNVGGQKVFAQSSAQETLAHLCMLDMYFRIVVARLLVLGGFKATSNGHEGIYDNTSSNWNKFRRTKRVIGVS